MIGNADRRTIAVVVITSVLILGTGAVGPVAADDSPPKLPLSVYGEVTIDGEPAPAGTEIVALIDGDERGEIVTTEDGVYGGSAMGDEKLVVDGHESDDGAAVTFLVDGTEADETVTWEPGADTEVTLTVDTASDGGGSIAVPAPDENPDSEGVEGENGSDSGDDANSSPGDDKADIDSSDGGISESHSSERSSDDDADSSSDDDDVDTDSSAGESDEGEDEVPGFTVTGTLVGLLLTFVLVNHRRRRIH